MTASSLSFDKFWGKLKRVAGRVPFAAEALAMWYCSIDPRTPKRVKTILVAALAYFVVPVDVIPDFLAGLGFTDDAATLFAAWSAVQPHVTEDHREKARAALERL